MTEPSPSKGLLKLQKELQSDPTLLDSELERIVGTFIALKYDVDTSDYSDGTLERWNNMKADIKALIATTVDEVIGQDEPKVWDEVLEQVIGADRKDEFHNVIEQKNKLRAEQRAKLQELINGR